MEEDGDWPRMLLPGGDMAPEFAEHVASLLRDAEEAGNELITPPSSNKEAPEDKKLKSDKHAVFTKKSAFPKAIHAEYLHLRQQQSLSSSARLRMTQLEHKFEEEKRSFLQTVADFATNGYGKTTRTSLPPYQATGVSMILEAWRKHSHSWIAEDRVVASCAHAGPKPEAFLTCLVSWDEELKKKMLERTMYDDVVDAVDCSWHAHGSKPVERVHFVDLTHVLNKDPRARVATKSKVDVTWLKQTQKKLNTCIPKHLADNGIGSSFVPLTEDQAIVAAVTANSQLEAVLCAESFIALALLCMGYESAPVPLQMQSVGGRTVLTGSLPSPTGIDVRTAAEYAMGPLLRHCFTKSIGTKELAPHLYTQWALNTPGLVSTHVLIRIPATWHPVVCNGEHVLLEPKSECLGKLGLEQVGAAHVHRWLLKMLLLQTDTLLLAHVDQNTGEVLHVGKTSRERLHTMQPAHMSGLERGLGTLGRVCAQIKTLAEGCYVVHRPPGQADPVISRARQAQATPSELYVGDMHTRVALCRVAWGYLSSSCDRLMAVRAVAEPRGLEIHFTQSEKEHAPFLFAPKDLRPAKRRY